MLEKHLLFKSMLKTAVLLDILVKTVIHFFDTQISKEGHLFEI